MRQVLFIGIMVMLQACGKSQVEKDAEAVCDCLEKTKNSESVKERSKCLDLQRSMGEQYLSDPEALKVFNDKVTPCIMEWVNKQQ